MRIGTPSGTRAALRRPGPGTDRRLSLPCARLDPRQAAEARGGQGGIAREAGRMAADHQATPARHVAGPAARRDAFAEPTDAGAARC